MGLNPYNFWYPIFAVFGIAVIAPATYLWIWPRLQNMPIHIQFLGTLVMPMLVLLLGASWLDPG